MMKYVIAATKDFSDNDYAACLSMMEPGRRAALLHRSTQAGRESALGEWLVKTLVAEHTGLPLAEIRLTRDERGKPRLSHPPLYCSISHSHGLAACAVSDKPVGIDIEKLRPVDLRAAGRIAHTEDAAFLEGAADDEKKFFLFWTAKEAYGKRAGHGLQNMRRVPLADILPHCTQTVTEDYVLTVCKTATP